MQAYVNILLWMECQTGTGHTRYLLGEHAQIVPFGPVMQSVLEFDNVGLRYGTDAETLTDLSFTLFPGSFYFLTGASGAGKTSLLMQKSWPKRN